MVAAAAAAWGSASPALVNTSQAAAAEQNGLEAEHRHLSSSLDVAVAAAAVVVAPVLGSSESVRQAPKEVVIDLEMIDCMRFGIYRLQSVLYNFWHPRQYQMREHNMR